MSRLTELLARAKAQDAQLGADLEREVKALQSRRAFGLNFERHQPEAIELPGRPVRKGDKVRVLPERGSAAKGDQTIWTVRTVTKGVARIERAGGTGPEVIEMPADDLVVVAEFRDPIFPGLVSTGKVERGGDKPFHTVINAENYHALKALTYTHRGKVDAIYIDPPYNSGARDWKYNNDYVEADDHYRHSKWLAMMERRLLTARDLLNPRNSVLIVTIDEKEYLRLGLLLEQTFPEARIQMISVLINTAAVARGAGFGRSDEYLFYVMLGAAAPERLRLDREWVSGRGRTHTGRVRWDLLRRSGTNTQRSHSPGCFYPIYVDPDTNVVQYVGEPLSPGVSSAPELPGLVAILPIRQDGSEGNWQWSPTTFRTRLEEGRVKIGGNDRRGFTVYILKPGEYKKIQSGEFQETGRASDGSITVEENDSSVVSAIPGTQWKISSHDATQYGSRLLAKMLPGRTFPFPKSLYAVEDSLRFFVSSKPNAIVLDFFAGSGTSAHAVMRLNRQDGGRRQCISVTNNEVAASEQKALREREFRPGDPTWEQWGIADHVTKPRIEAAITGRTPDGAPIKGDYKFIDEFSMADGFAENAEFFTLTYEAPLAVDHNRAFERIAPLLWMRAGSRGPRIDALPAAGWAVVDSYGLLTDLDQMELFCAAISREEDARIAFIVTNDNRRYEAVARELPEGVEPVRLYESYLSNFRFASGGEE